MMKRGCILAAFLLCACVLVSCSRTRSDGLHESFIPGEESASSGEIQATEETDPSGGINVEIDSGDGTETSPSEEEESSRDYTVAYPNLSVTTDSTAYCVIDDTEQVYAAKNMLDRKAPASITKVLTALIVYENVSLDKTVTVTEEELSRDIIVMSSGVRPSLRAGEQFTVRDLLFMLILESTNTAGNVLADAVAGSNEAFAELMNKKCASLGLTHSHFANPHGLDADDHYSCAYDMAVILRNAMSVPEIAQMLSAISYTVPATDYAGERVLSAGHSMLNGDFPCSGAISGKPGWTVDARATLLTAFSRNGKNFYICTMNSDEGMHYVDTANLANSVYAQFNGEIYDSIPLTHDVSIVNADAEGVVIRFSVDNANAASRTAWWNTKLGTAAASFAEFGELHGVNEVRFAFPEAGTYAVQLFSKNGSGVEKGIMVYVLYTGSSMTTGVATWQGQNYVIDENGFMKVGEPEMTFGTYCTDANGCILKDTITYGGYFAGPDGKLLTGWQDFTGGKYYFQPDGRMATGRIVIDGEAHTFTDGGILTE